MPRPRILPLPDELARPIARGVQAIEAARPGSSNREFLREFVPLVVEVTGELFGAQTFQKLLRQMAPHRTPSSTTVHDEIHKYRSEARAEAQLAPSDPPRRSVNAIVDIATLNRTGSRRIDTESVSRDEAALAAVELGKLHQLEVERLRSRAEIMEARATAADAARQGAVADAIAARAEAVGLQEAVANFQTLVKQLSETIQLTQERAAADNRANLLRVDEVRRETREVEEKLKAAQSTIVLREQALRNANALGDSLRQQLNELRRQLQVRDE